MTGEAWRRYLQTGTEEETMLETLGSAIPARRWIERQRAQFSRDLADFTIYVIDVSGGDKIARKGGPGITQSDLLVINKTDLAPLVGADLDVMGRDSRRMRGEARWCSPR